MTSKTLNQPPMNLPLHDVILKTLDTVGDIEDEGDVQFVFYDFEDLIKPMPFKKSWSETFSASSKVLSNSNPDSNQNIESTTESPSSSNFSSTRECSIPLSGYELITSRGALNSRKKSKFAKYYKGRSPAISATSSILGE